MTVLAVAPPRGPSVPWVVAAALLVAMALAGLTRVPGLVESAGASSREARPVVATGAGAVTLAGFELLDGPTPEELGGVTHGIGGYVDSAHALVRIHVTLTGNGNGVPASMFALVGPDGTVQPPDAHTLPMQELVDGADLDASLSFVVPRHSGSYALRVTDSADSTDLPLGAVDAPPRPSPHQH